MSGEKKSREQLDYHDYGTTGLVSPGARLEPRVAIPDAQPVDVEREYTRGWIPHFERKV